VDVPALLTRTSIYPNFSCTCVKAVAMESSDDMSIKSGSAEETLSGERFCSLCIASSARVIWPREPIMMWYDSGRANKAFAISNPVKVLRVSNLPRNIVHWMHLTQPRICTSDENKTLRDT
jgi:hypothetical protein